MRIAMIVEAWEPIWGGGQAHAFELSKKLATDYDCKIDIYTMNILDVNNVEQKNIEEFENGKIRIIRTAKIRNFYSFKDRLLWIPEVIKAISNNHGQEKYTILHAHANLPCIPGKILSTHLKIPVIQTIHGSNFLDLNKKNIFYFIENILFTKLKYDLQITVSENFLRYRNVNKAVYIPNGVDIEKFDNAYEKYIQKKDGTKFKIIFVGRFDKIKGINLLINVASNLRNILKNKHVEICLVGYGYDEINLKNQVNKLNLNNIITFKGRMSGIDLLQEYINSDLFILPSLSEGFPLTILEAWAARLPVLVTDVGEIPKITQDGITGFIVPAGNEKSLKEALIKILNNDNLKNIGVNGYAKIKENYTWSKIAKKTYALYSKTLKK